MDRSSGSHGSRRSKRQRRGHAPDPIDADFQEHLETISRILPTARVSDEPQLYPAPQLYPEPDVANRTWLQTNVNIGRRYAPPKSVPFRPAENNPESHIPVDELPPFNMLMISGKIRCDVWSHRGQYEMRFRKLFGASNGPIYVSFGDYAHLQNIPNQRPFFCNSSDIFPPCTEPGVESMPFFTLGWYSRLPANRYKILFVSDVPPWSVDTPDRIAPETYERDAVAFPTGVDHHIALHDLKGTIKIIELFGGARATMGNDVTRPITDSYHFSASVSNGSRLYMSGEFRRLDICCTEESEVSNELSTTEHEMSASEVNVYCGPRSKVSGIYAHDKASTYREHLGAVAIRSTPTNGRVIAHTRDPMRPTGWLATDPTFPRPAVRRHRCPMRGTASSVCS